MAHDNRNHRYKGKNYDPNYKWNRPRPQVGGNPGREGYPQQYPYPHPQPHPRRQHQHPRPQRQHQYIGARSLAAMRVLENFRNEIQRMMIQDYEGDIRMCECSETGGMCFQDLSRLYRDQLMKSAELQCNIVELLDFLIEGEPSQGVIAAMLTEYANNNPGTLLSTILETTGVNGIVTRGYGTVVGQSGVQLLIDSAAEANFGIM